MISTPNKLNVFRKLLGRSVRSVSVAGFAAGLLLAGTFQSDAQSQDAVSKPLAFDVASVKQNQSKKSKSSTSIAANADGVKLSMQNATLIFCLQKAYGVKEYQISGPDWLKSNRYDIVATAQRVSTEQLMLMLQGLLAERFKLVLHRETKSLPVYALVVAKNGPKIHEVEAVGQSGTWEGRGRLTARKISMAQLAETLSRQMDRPVKDMTGLTGVFDFSVEYAKEDNHPKHQEEGDGSAAVESSAPSIFTALQEQLGLKLDAKKAPVDILRIDHAERTPTEN